MRDRAGIAASATLHLIDSRLSFHNLNWCERLDATVTVHHAEPALFWEFEFFSASGTIVAKATIVAIAQASVEPASPEPDNSRSEGKLSTSALKDKPEHSLALDRREIIAKAASEIIADKGFAAASMREIAAASGMHVPTMYQYVKSKEEVLELVYRWVIQRVHTNVNPALTLDLPAERKLNALLKDMITGIDSMRRETGVLNRETRSLSRPARNRVLEDYAEIIGRIGHLISEGVEAGSLRSTNPLLAANFIDAICDTWALRQFAFGAYDIEAFKEEATNFVLHGLLNQNAGQRKNTTRRRAKTETAPQD